MTEGVLIALISTIGLILAGVLAELIRARRQSITRLDTAIRQQDELNTTLRELNATLNAVDKRLVAVETTVKLTTPMGHNNVVTEHRPAAH